MGLFASSSSSGGGVGDRRTETVVVVLESQQREGGGGILVNLSNRVIPANQTLQVFVCNTNVSCAVASNASSSSATTTPTPVGVVPTTRVMIVADHMSFSGGASLEIVVPPASSSTAWTSLNTRRRRETVRLRALGSCGSCNLVPSQRKMW